MYFLFTYQKKKCIFVGYLSTQKGYKCFYPPTNFFFCLYGCHFCRNSKVFFSSSSLGGEIPMEDKDMFLLEFPHTPKSSSFGSSNGTEKGSKVMKKV